MTCRISHFQDGGSFQLEPLVTTCRLRTLRRIVTNHIRRYKQIALELLFAASPLSTQHRGESAKTGWIRIRI